MLVLVVPGHPQLATIMEWASGRLVTPCSPVKAPPVATTSTHGKSNSSSDSGLPHNPKDDRPQTLRIGGFQSSSAHLPRLGAARIPASSRKLCDAENSIIGDLLRPIRKRIGVLPGNFPVQFYLQERPFAPSHIVLPFGWRWAC